MVLHYARLAELAGGVDGFLIGSELRGLTTVRDGLNSYPGVRALRRLAGECRAVLRPETAISYAADWSEWFGHQPADGSGHVAFHLDPLWSDPAISFVGVDWYPPGADWRDGRLHLDALAGYDGRHDPIYLGANVAGGEGFDWFYASPADRDLQVRTPITDGAHGEPWVFRPKDIVSWWSNPHHDRPAGVRSAAPTGWVPRSKPVRLIEFGAPAVDKGANSPNLFYDPKSSESALPPFSDGSRDDLGQRRALEAVLAHFADPLNNPVSDAYAGPMVETMSAWCWDARPFPDFPGRSRVWADAPNWTGGHWLNGRAGVAPAAELIQAVLARGGVTAAELDVSAVRGALTGYVVDRPMTLREAVSPLLEVFAVDASERGRRLTFTPRDGAALLDLAEDDLAWPDRADAPERRGRKLDELPGSARVRYVDDAGEYAVAAASVRSSAPGLGGALDFDLPVIAGRGVVEQAAQRRLQRAAAEIDDIAIHLSPDAALRVEPGDRVTLGGNATVWRVTKLELDDAPRAVLVRAEPPDGSAPTAGTDWRPGEAAEPPAPPVLHLLDLPPLGFSQGGERDGRMLAAVAGEPWRGAQVMAGVSAAVLSLRGTAIEPAAIGVTLTALPRGPLHRLHPEGRLTVRLEGARLESRAWLEVAAGANALAVLQTTGEWEVLQFMDAVRVGPETYLLKRLLRGMAGTEGSLAELLGAGAPVVLLNRSLARVETGLAERDAPLLWRASPMSGPAALSTDATFTWRNLHARPWAPAHLRGRRTAEGGVRFTWARRARIGGDSWAGKPPLSEEGETYRLELSSAAGVVRSWETMEPAADYTPEQVAADFPDGLPSSLQVAVRQGSVSFGWGVPTTRSLWL